MNTKEKASKEIFEFLESDKKCLLLTGTHMFKKHELLISILNTTSDKKILFRANAMNNLGTILKIGQNIKSGIPYGVHNNTWYFDSLEVTTWRRSPFDLDYAIIYPVGSMLRKDSYKKVLEDLNQKGVDKVFLVSCQETQDYSVLDRYVDYKVEYDAEEDDPDYHNRVLEDKKRY